MALTKVNSILVDGAINTDASGNVGIGTSSPATKLHVSNTSGSTQIRVSSDTDVSVAAVASGADSTAFMTVINDARQWTLRVNGAESDQFQVRDSTAGATRMAIDSSGNLLVGIGGPYDNSKVAFQRGDTVATGIVLNLHNTASTSTTKGNNGGRLLRLASNANGADTHINFTDSVANNYLFGGNSGGAYVMANSNGVRLNNGATSWSSDSDERVKDIIEPITDAANKVSTLRAVIGKYKTDEEGVRRSFLIAQDVQAVLPEAVVAQEDEIGTLSLAYTDTIPLLVAAIQEQQAIITDLKARIETLEAK
jgi:hypothetical protein